MNLYVYRQFVKSWGWQPPYYRTSSGPSWNDYCRSTPVLVARGKTTGRFWKEFFGYSKLVRGGAICRETLALAPPPAGGDCACGKNRMSGLKCGGVFSGIWINVASWIGVRALLTGVSLPPKRGRWPRQNQAWQGHKVDGGGRRPRYSSGKLLGQRLARGSEIGGQNLAAGACAAPRLWSPQEQIAPSHCRSGLRQRSSAKKTARMWHRIDLSTSIRSQKTSHARWSCAASLSQTLENRTYLCLVGTLPATDGSPRTLVARL